MSKLCTYFDTDDVHLKEELPKKSNIYAISHWVLYVPTFIVPKLIELSQTYD